MAAGPPSTTMKAAAAIRFVAILFCIFLHLFLGYFLHLVSPISEKCAHRARSGISIVAQLRRPERDEQKMVSGLRPTAL